MPSPDGDGLLLVCGAWDGRGGLQQQLRALVGELGSDRAVTVLTWGRPGRTVEGGATVVRLPTPWPWTGELSKWRGRINVAAAVSTGVPVALVLRRRWTVALAVGLDPEALVALPAAWLGRRRAVARTWLVGPWGNVARLRRSAAGSVVLRLLRRTVVVAETDEAADELLAAGIGPELVRVVPHGTDLDRWRAAGPLDRDAARRRLGVDDAAGVVAYCGRFDLRQKRLDVLLSGWRGAAMPGWRLVLAGEGPDEAAVRDLAEGLDPAPVFLSWQADARSVLAAADAFVVPTDAETTGQAMLEGMAMGLPGIVSATPSLLARRPDGVVLVPNQGEAWSAALSALAGDPDGRARRGAAARAWVEAHHDERKEMTELRAVLGL